jgi:MFS family permease
MSKAAKSVNVGLNRNAASTSQLPEPNPVLLTVILLSVFMAVALIVNVRIPTIQLDLRASFEDVQLVITGYTLSYAVALIIGGRLGDKFRRNKIDFLLLIIYLMIFSLIILFLLKI